MGIEWLWLLLALAGLGLLWLAIMGMEQLVKRVKSRDDARRADSAVLEQKIAHEEADFLRVRAAKDFIENGQPDVNADPNEVPQEFKDAISVLSGDELLDSMVKRAFGENRGAADIIATQSAFDHNPAKTVVAKGNGVLPVKAQPATKSSLTKAEEKMFKKIKQKG